MHNNYIKVQIQLQIPQSSKTREGTTKVQISYTQNMHAKTKNNKHLTAIKSNMSPVKLNLTAVNPCLHRQKTPPKTDPNSRGWADETTAKYKVQMSRDKHVDKSTIKVQIPQSTNNRHPVHARHSSTKVQIFLQSTNIMCPARATLTKYKFLKVQTSRERHVTNVHSAKYESVYLRQSTSNVHSAKYELVYLRQSTSNAHSAKYELVYLRQSAKYKYHAADACAPQLHKSANSRTSCINREFYKLTHHQSNIATKSTHTAKCSHKPTNLTATRATYTPIHTPYGPHNLPHMVLCTKKGPVNA